MNSNGEKIKQLRKDNNMTQQQFAEKIGVARSTLAGYETGTIVPRFKVLSRICEQCNVPISYFMDEDSMMIVTPIEHNHIKPIKYSSKNIEYFNVASALRTVLLNMNISKKVVFNSYELNEDEQQILFNLIKRSLGTYEELLKELKHIQK